MAKEDILNRIRDAYSSKTDIVFPMATMPPDITPDEIASEIENLTGKDVRGAISQARNSGSNFRIPFSTLSSPALPKGEPNLGAGKATAIRGRTTSEKIFNPLSEAATQVGAQLASGPLPLKLAIPFSGAVSQGIEIAREMAQASFGEEAAPKTFSESLGRQAKAFIGGAGAEAVTRGVIKSGAAILPSGIPLSPAQKATKDLMESKGITPSISDITKDSRWARLEAWLENSLGGAKPYQIFRERQVAEAKDVINSLAKKKGTTLTDSEVNLAIKNSVLEKTKEVAAKTNKLYAKAEEMINPESQVSLDATRKIAKGLSEKSQKGLIKINRGDLDSVINQLKTTRSVGTGMLDQFGRPISREIPVTYSTLKQDISTLGDLINDEVMIPAAQGMARNMSTKGRVYVMLKNALMEDRDNFFKNASPEAQEAFSIAKSLDFKNIPEELEKKFAPPGAQQAAESARQAYAKEKEMTSSAIAQRILKMDETTASNLLVNAKNINAVKDIKNILGPKKIYPIQKRVVQDIVDSAIKNDGDRFLSNGIANAIDKYDRKTLETLLGPKTVKELIEISKATQALGTAEKMAGNFSRTQQMRQTSEALTFTGILRSIPTNIVAKIMTSDIGRKLIINGIKYPPGSPEFAKNAIRFSNFAALAAATEKKGKK